jgi:adenylate cyclase
VVTVLEGSVRRAGNRIRVTAQLVDATTGSHVWASRYDRDLADIFAVQDEITAAIAAAIAPAIVDAEQQRALRKPAERLDAWEAYHRGMWHFAMANRESYAIAKDFFQKSVDLDPNFATAYAALAAVVFLSAVIFYRTSLDEAARTSEQVARKALSLDPSDAFAHARLAAAIFAAGDLDACISECNEALALDTNCAIAHGVKGGALMFAGRREEGRVSIRVCLRLNPRDPARASRLHNIALSYYLDGNYEVAVEACRDVIRRHQGDSVATYRILLASLGQLGQHAECEALMKIAPPDYDHYARHRPPWFGLKDFEHMLEGLRKAGWSA